MLEEDGAFCRFAPGHFLTFFEYAKNFQEIKKIQEVNSKMVIIERATDLWNPTLGILSVTKFQIRSKFWRFDFYNQVSEIYITHFRVKMIPFRIFRISKNSQNFKFKLKFIFRDELDIWNAELKYDSSQFWNVTKILFQFSKFK